MKILLTKRKQKWVSSRNPDVLRGTPISPNAAPELRYFDSLAKLIYGMTLETEREIKRLFNKEPAKEHFAMDASVSSQARILTNALIKKFMDKFAKNAKPIAERLANEVDAASSAQVHSSIRQLSGGLSLPTANLDGQLKDMLSATITENVNLIKSIPQQYLNGVQQAVMRSIAGGTTPENLTEYLRKHKGITLRRARMIAMDQNRKAMQGLSRGRMKNLGIRKFIWLHTGGSNEPRELHVRMSGNIYSFDDPPIIDERTGERGFPGDAVNCRCKMQPVIDFKD